MEPLSISLQAARSNLLVFSTGDEVVSLLKEFAKKAGITAAQFNAVGALERAVVAYFDWLKKQYQKIEVNEQVEVISVYGNLSLVDGEPKVHSHICLGRRDGSVMGGHLMEAHVRPTLELTLYELGGTLIRKKDPETGLTLIDVGASRGNKKSEEAA